jgi:poly-beta-1,6-N-acetyl-D-glucosamine synthase
VRNRLNSDVAVIMTVWNEEDSIADVLDALDEQILRPSAVVIVDDGSTDTTPSIIEEGQAKYRFKLSVVTRASCSRSRGPGRAYLLNQALAVLKLESSVPAYVMKLDGDHILSRHYIEKVVARMEADPCLAVAGGWIVDEWYDEEAPRGSGLIIRTSFWQEASGLQFIPSYGWETWVRLKALQMGYTTRSFKDVLSWVTRKTNYSDGIVTGRAMYACGFYWLGVLLTSLTRARQSPRLAVQIVSAYLGPGGISKLDISDWVRTSQKKSTFDRISQILKNPEARTHRPISVLGP